MNSWHVGNGVRFEGAATFGFGEPPAAASVVRNDGNDGNQQEAVADSAGGVGATGAVRVRTRSRFTVSSPASSPPADMIVRVGAGFPAVGPVPGQAPAGVVAAVPLAVRASEADEEGSSGAHSDVPSLSSDDAAGVAGWADWGDEARPGTPLMQETRDRRWGALRDRVAAVYPNALIVRLDSGGARPLVEPSAALPGADAVGEEDDGCGCDDDADLSYWAKAEQLVTDGVLQDTPYGYKLVEPLQVTVPRNQRLVLLAEPGEAWTEYSGNRSWAAPQAAEVDGIGEEQALVWHAHGFRPAAGSTITIRLKLELGSIADAELEKPVLRFLEILVAEPIEGVGDSSESAASAEAEATTSSDDGPIWV